MKGKLVFSSGQTFAGELIGDTTRIAAGEVVFNTSMTGYQEILTDPSYYGQIVVLTYPLIGNYGTFKEAAESLFPWSEGVVMHKISDIPSKFGGAESLDNYLKRYQKVGLTNVDTRALTKLLRAEGTQQAVIVSDNVSQDNIHKALSAINLRDAVYQVTTPKSYTIKGEGPHVVVVDYGVKNSIVNELVERGAQVTVVPAAVTAEELRELNPDGVILSNGPGDPESVPDVLNTVRHAIENYPTMGICLGHQLIGIAEGASTYRLKFGHHGANHPLMDHKKNRVMITSQNHGYAVKADALLDRYDIRLTNLHDGTVEGLQHRALPILTVQHHPEAGPGPNDSYYLFDEFMEMVSSRKDHAHA